MFWKGVLGYLPVNIVQGVVGLLTIVAFTRLLTPAQYGDYALALSVVVLFHTTLFTWTEAAMARFQPMEASKGNLAHHFATLYKAWGVMAVVMIIAAVLVTTVWPMPIGLRVAVGTGLAGTVLKGLARLAQEHRRAAGRVSAAAAIDMITTAGGFAGGALFAWMGLGGAAPLTGLAAVTAAVLVFCLPSELKMMKGGAFEPTRAKTYAAYGLPLAGSLILTLALNSVDRLLIAAYMNETSVGTYHAGYSLANRTLDVMFIWLGSAAGPAAIAALEFGGMPALHATARQQSSFMILLTLPAAVGLALVAKPLAHVLVGPALAEGAAHVTPWIAASGLFSGLTTYYFHTAFTLGKATRLMLAAMAVPAAANIILNVALIPHYGLNGAVIATAVSYGLGLLASAILGRRVIKLPIPWDTLVRSGAASAVMAIAVSLIPAMGGVLELGLKAAAGGLVYGAVAYGLNAGGLREHGRQLLGSLKARTATA
jgi:O-antigen/teichoic acid export membrane protein